MKRLMLAVVVLAVCSLARGQGFTTLKEAERFRQSENYDNDQMWARSDEDIKKKTTIKGEPFRKWERPRGVAKLVAFSPDRVWFQMKDGSTKVEIRKLLTKNDKAILKIRLDKFAKDKKRLKATPNQPTQTLSP